MDGSRGGALVVSGVAYDLANMSLGDDLESARENHDGDAFNETKDDILSGRIVEGLLYGAGVAAIVTGVVLLVTQSDDLDEPEEGVTVRLTTHGLGVGLRGSF